ncbi:MAG TPA: hypothetical protein VFN21_06620 [Acidimicrobiales bacterium]|nr:hypothetical protein [Acidimicrobiales bacterium]
MTDLVWCRAGLVWTQGAAIGITFGLDAVPAELRWLTEGEASDFVGFGVARRLTDTRRPRRRHVIGRTNTEHQRLGLVQ